MNKFNVYILVIMIILLAAMLVGCGNKQLLDTTYTFNKAYISLPNGSVISGKVESWKDYDDGDQLQVRINGKTYLTSAVNVVLIAE